MKAARLQEEREWTRYRGNDVMRLPQHSLMIRALIGMTPDTHSARCRLVWLKYDRCTCDMDRRA